MAQARVAACAASALLLMCAVMHFRPAHKLTAESFVSAALDIETLDQCTAEFPRKLNADGTPGGPLNQAPQTATDPIYVQKDGPCVCKNSICTNGRVCHTEGATGQCYLPRCPPTGTDIPTAYMAGCFCADTTVFTSADKSIGMVASPMPSTPCVAGTVATEDCKCGDGTDGAESYCYKGQTCTKDTPAQGKCDGKRVLRQDYHFAVPSISSNAFTDATKFAICKSTAHTTRQCTLPAPLATQEGTQASPTCTVID